MFHGKVFHIKYYIDWFCKYRNNHKFRIILTNYYRAWMSKCGCILPRSYQGVRVIVTPWFYPTTKDCYDNSKICLWNLLRGGGVDLIDNVMTLYRRVNAHFSISSNPTTISRQVSSLLRSLVFIYYDLLQWVLDFSPSNKQNSIASYFLEVQNSATTIERLTNEQFCTRIALVLQINELQFNNIGLPWYFNKSMRCVWLHNRWFALTVR